MIRGFLAVGLFAVSMLTGFWLMKKEAAHPDHILVVLAHPDDETMMAGTLVFLQSLGKSIKIIYATAGEGGRFHRLGPEGLVVEEFPAEAMKTLRLSELERAMAGLGMTDYQVLGARDEPMRDDFGVPSRSLSTFLRAGQWRPSAMYRELLSLMREFRPGLIITMGQHPDLHVHHQAIGYITLEAAGSLPYRPSVYAVGEQRWIDDTDLPARHEFRLDLSMNWPTEDGAVPLGELVYRSIRHYVSQPPGLVGVPRDTERIYLVDGPVYPAF